MVKSKLIRALKDKLPELQERDVELAVNCILRQMTDALAQGERIEIRGFGSFDCRHNPPRLTRNPKTGAVVHSSATVKVHFKPGKDMKDRVNASSHQCGITE
ncbi:MAG: HU family DNA-binding protein [Methylococcales bacterium]